MQPPTRLPDHDIESIPNLAAMKFAHFPILIPAFTAQVSPPPPLSPSLRVSHQLSNGGHLQIEIDTPLAVTADLLSIPFLPRSGSITSEPSYPYRLRAFFIHGSDFLRRDADGDHVRLDVASTAQDTITGALLKFTYNGVVDVTGDEGKVIRGDENATTTGFGNACEYYGSAVACHGLWRVAMHQSKRLLERSRAGKV